MSILRECDELRVLLRSRRSFPGRKDCVSWLLGERLWCPNRRSGGGQLAEFKRIIPERSQRVNRSVGGSPLGALTSCHATHRE